MAEPTPGIQRQDTFGSVGRKVLLVTRYTKTMLRKIRRKNANGVLPSTTEMTPVPRQILAQDDSIRDVSWDDVTKEIKEAGQKHVLVNFYSPHVWTLLSL